MPSGRSHPEKVILEDVDGWSSLLGHLRQKYLKRNLPKLIWSRSLKPEKFIFKSNLFLLRTTLTSMKVLRAKGMVRTSEGNRLVQVSLSGLDVSSLDTPLEVSQLVFIGKKIDAARLEADLKEILDA